MWNSANGIDDSPVVSEERDPKGYSNETTLPYDVTDSSEALSITTPVEFNNIGKSFSISPNDKI